MQFPQLKEAGFLNQLSMDDVPGAYAQSDGNVQRSYVSTCCVGRKDTTRNPSVTCMKYNAYYDSLVFLVYPVSPWLPCGIKESPQYIILLTSGFN